MDHLRDRQIPVIRAALEYIREPFLADDAPRFARIIMPTRTGKTHIAADTVAKHGGSSLFLGPTQAIVEQAAEVFRRQLPGQPIYTVMQGSRDVGQVGHVCSTIQSLLAMQKAGSVPDLIRNADIVFADEAHRFMTELRQGILQEMFRPEAVRIALTATPDYDEERSLARYFPDLIHEMTIREGVEAGLLASYQAEALAIDVGATDLRVLAGDFDSDRLGLVMSRLPMLKAAALVRYSPEYRDIPALMTCSSRAQALALAGYLGDNRPAGTPVPGIAISGFDKELVRTARGMFDDRQLDTLITVGMLLEGWDAPHCKLLVDLSPSLSWVRSAQKYSRAMTKVGKTVANMVVLVPSDLSRRPIMPKDVFGPGLDDTDPADPIPTHEYTPRRQRSLILLSKAGIRVEDADVILSRIAEEKFVPKPEDSIRLDPKDRNKVRKIVRRTGFRLRAGETAYAEFITRLFVVQGLPLNGNQLLKALGFQQRLIGYKHFLQEYAPDAWADYVLSWSDVRAERTFGVDLKSLRYDEDGHEIFDYERIVTRTSLEERESTASEFRREYYMHDECLKHIWSRSEESRLPDQSILAVSGAWRPQDPCMGIDERRLVSDVTRSLDTLSPMEARILRWRYGIDGEDELSLKEIGERYNLSRERMRQMSIEAMNRLAPALIRHRSMSFDGFMDIGREAVVHFPGGQKRGIIGSKSLGDWVESGVDQTRMGRGMEFEECLTVLPSLGVENRFSVPKRLYWRTAKGLLNYSPQFHLGVRAWIQSDRMLKILVIKRVNPYTDPSRYLYAVLSCRFRD
jgi:superfamily II DNA or RNA helicase